jgi:peptide/nickel transport system substrate-binding protein
LETDDAKREALVLQAVKLFTDDVAIIPPYHFKNIWATRSSLRYEPCVGELTLAPALTSGSPQCAAGPAIGSGCGPFSDPLEP